MVSLLNRFCTYSWKFHCPDRISKAVHIHPWKLPRTAAGTVGLMAQEHLSAGNKGGASAAVGNDYYLFYSTVRSISISTVP